MVPRENKNNAYAKFEGDKQRVLWYFPKWPIKTKLSNLNLTTGIISVIVTLLYSFQDFYIASFPLIYFNNLLFLFYVFNIMYGFIVIWLVHI